MTSAANQRIAADDAPGDLVLVQSFLNTAPTGAGARVRPELLTDADSVRRWAIEVLEPRGYRVDDLAPADVDAIRHLRQSLRSSIAGQPGDRAVADVGLELDPKGEVEVVDDGGRGGLRGIILATVMIAQAAGDWPRLKICALSGCAAAYYDRSRNTSGRYHTHWCANTANLRASRERKKSRAAELSE